MLHNKTGATVISKLYVRNFCPLKKNMIVGTVPPLGSRIIHIAEGVNRL